MRSWSPPESWKREASERRLLTGGNTEPCLINAPTAGVYHVMIKGYTDSSGLTLQASY
ncbi:hypothetical protein NR800_21685 [Corallococcus interemptor]|uniref:hypothetical protein n=1 Tax=Corallococcus TaxID=83461 RepID=UPI001CBDF6C0|nr:MULTISPECIES: hypothetical protein [unclassified Corallococcus]MBZ4330318.1 hypothetical protein [Corallococcus sp. AS-1-12]MBZ4373651.1 hypothetical protein [Corallococcus sp. AS-1-6]